MVEKRNMLYAKMVTADLKKRIFEITKLNLQEGGYIPENMEELQLHMDSNFKQKHEVSIEQGIEFVMKLNQYEDLRKKNNKRSYYNWYWWIKSLFRSCSRS